MKTTKKDAYELVTNEIIKGLENDIIAWEKSWVSIDQAPRNAVSNKPYRGINVLLLGLYTQLFGYNDPRWVTYSQAKKLGGHVKKGERSAPVVLWLPIYKHTNECGENYKERCENIGFGEDDCKKRVHVANYSVFNVEQCDGLKISKIDLPTGVSTEYSPIEEAEQIISEYISRENIATGTGQRAYYSPTDDKIVMPEHNAFKNNEAYYDTFFHEIGHSTGHSSRLNRQNDGQPVHFGSESYANEELVAEMTSGFLSNIVGIDNPKSKEQRVAYIQGWLKALKNDKKLVIIASSQAQKATDMIINK